MGRIDGKETGVELTLIKASSAEHIIEEVLRLARKKHDSYNRRGIFKARSTILLGTLDWPAKGVEGPALYDVHDEISGMIEPSDFADFGFGEIWLMDEGFKYTSRTDSRVPADFFCFKPADKIGFWERPRKRRLYSGAVRDFMT